VSSQQIAVTVGVVSIAILVALAVIFIAFAVGSSDADFEDSGPIPDEEAGRVPARVRFRREVMRWGRSEAGVRGPSHEPLRGWKRRLGVVVVVLFLVAVVLLTVLMGLPDSPGSLSRP
jgi:hypothetical protein